MRRFSTGSLALKVSLALVLGAGVAYAHPEGRSIAINFGADEPNGARSDVLGEAGVLRTVNWNNFDANIGGPNPVDIDDGGDVFASGATVTWTSNNTWSSWGRGEENNTAPDGDDRNLMTGYLDTTDTSITEVIVDNIEDLFDDDDEPFDVYIYMKGGVNNRGGDYEITIDGVSQGIQSHVDTAAFDGAYRLGPDGDYIVFSGLVGNSFTLTARATTTALFRGPLNAIEIVAGGAVVRLPSRTMTPAVNEETCQRGPVSVTISNELGEDDNPDEVVTIVENVRGDVTSAAQITANDDGMVENIFPEGTFVDGYVRDWLLLGPLMQGGGAAPLVDDIRLDYLTDGAGIDELTVEPRAGDTVNTDYNGAAASTGLAANTVGLNPGDVPTWAVYVDEDDTLNFNDHYGGDINNIMMYAVTYVNLDTDMDVFLCIGSDDAVQVLVDGVEVWINSIARGVGGPGVCQDTAGGDPFDPLTPLELSAGTHRIMMKVFEGGGGHGLRLGFLDEVLVPITEGISVCHDPDAFGDCPLDPIGARITWTKTRQELVAGVSYEADVFEGLVTASGLVNATPISGASRATLSCISEVSNVACVVEANGDVTVSWDNNPFADPLIDIEITLDGAFQQSVTGDVSSATIPAAEVDTGIHQVCVTNSSGVSICCGFGVGVVILSDIIAGGDGTGTADPAVIGINADTGMLETAHLNQGIPNTGDFLQAVPEDQAPLLDSVLIPSTLFSGDVQINTAGVLYTLDLGDGTGGTYNHILKDVTHSIDAGIVEIWAGGINTWGSAVSIHASAGVTFDLTAIRAAGGDGAGAAQELETFSSFIGSDTCAGNTGMSFHVVFSDDEEVISATRTEILGPNQGEMVEVPVPEEALYLTLIAGALDSSINCAHGVFANALMTTGGGPPVGVPFVRGDANNDRTANISDAQYILNFLFLGGPGLACAAAGDANSDGTTNISDAQYILNFLFLGGPGIAAPNACGQDPLTTVEQCADAACAN